MLTHLLQYFTDPILSPPLWATLLMCLCTSVIGTLIVVRRRALLGEAISHTTYLGIALMIYFGADLLATKSWLFPILVIVGAFLSAYVGLKMIFYLEKWQKTSSDSALTFVLSTFLGLGVLMASRMQVTHPIWVMKIEMFLYGQVATLTPSHVWVYAGLTFLVVGLLTLFYPLLSISLFDEEYGRVCGIQTRFFYTIVRVLLISAIVIGIRCVGVLMMSGMLIAPAAAAKMVARKFSHLFIIAALFGMCAGVIGYLGSVELSEMMSQSVGGFRVTFATGPMILVVAVICAMGFVLFSRKRGYLWKKIRQQSFIRACQRENVLKAIYKYHDCLSLGQIHHAIGVSRFAVLRAIFILKAEGFLKKTSRKWTLTEKGESKVRRIIRLHRLWEVYLFKVLSVSASDVHTSAEEMEHILTPEIEKKLTEMLGDPKRDPHNQAIPAFEGGGG